jgi:hypothetical protein
LAESGRLLDVRLETPLTVMREDGTSTGALSMLVSESLVERIGMS